MRRIDISASGCPGRSTPGSKSKRYDFVRTSDFHNYAFLGNERVVNLNVAKNILQKSPSPFPLPVGERGRGEGQKLTAGDVQRPRGKAICTP
jgi:hypothetical protein